MLSLAVVSILVLWNDLVVEEVAEGSKVSCSVMSLTFHNLSEVIGGRRRLCGRSFSMITSSLGDRGALEVISMPLLHQGKGQALIW